MSGVFIDILPCLQKSALNAHEAGPTIVAVPSVHVIISTSLDEFISRTAVSWSKRLVPGAEDEVGRVGRDVVLNRMAILRQ